MKIAVTGTHGSGKSYLQMEKAQALKLAHPGKEIGLVQEIARSCPYLVNGGMTLRSQCWIACAQCTAETEAEHRSPIVLTDRCIIDPWVYGMAYNVRGVEEALRGIVEAWLPTYDRIILVDARRHDYLTPDGFREVDPDQRLKVYDLLHSWLQFYAAQGRVKKLEVV